MKLGLLVILLSSFVFGHYADSDVTHHSDEADVRKAVADLVEVQKRYDVSAVDKLLDGAFIYVANDGTLINRADFLSLTDEKKNPIELLTVTEITVGVSGNTAIATGLVHEKGLLEGKPYEFRGRTLDTYVKKNGRWLRLAIHD
jgi:ketosteroid isomerase-like protein